MNNLPAVAMACNACGATGRAVISETFASGAIRWSYDFLCVKCGHGFHADSVGEMTEPFRSAVLAVSGVRLMRGGRIPPPIGMRAIRAIQQLSLAEAQEAWRQLVAGVAITPAEAAQLRSLIGEGASFEPVRDEPP